jgi:hypothetical protein
VGCWAPWRGVGGEGMSGGAIRRRIHESEVVCLCPELTQTASGASSKPFLEGLTTGFCLSAGCRGGLGEGGLIQAPGTPSLWHPISPPGTPSLHPISPPLAPISTPLRHEGLSYLHPTYLYSYPSHISYFVYVAIFLYIPAALSISPISPECSSSAWGSDPPPPASPSQTVARLGVLTNLSYYCILLLAILWAIVPIIANNNVQSLFSEGSVCPLQYKGRLP